jgi:alkylated DNA repair dioxygenase AlkB
MIKRILLEIMVKFMNVDMHFDEDKTFYFDESKKAYIKSFPSFIQTSQLNTVELFDNVKDNAIWHQPNVKMHGKDILYPRFCASMCDLSEYEKYKKYIDTPVHWTKPMLQLKEAVEKATGITYGYCQINHYKDNTQYIGLHRDRETKRDETICSISLGVTRTFIVEPLKSVRQGNESPTRYKLDLHDGDMCLMSYEACGPKSNYKHGITKCKDKVGERIVITFRN